MISRSETISGFKLEALTSSEKHIAGLKFANSLNSFLNLNNALSGLLENSS